MTKRNTKKGSTATKFALKNMAVFWGAGVGGAITGGNPLGMLGGAIAGTEAYKKAEKWLGKKYRR